MTTQTIIDFCRNSPELTEDQNAACSRICIANDNGNDISDVDRKIIESAMRES